MGLLKLSAKCQACPFVDTYDNKEMETLGFLPLSDQPTQPIETGYRNIENFWDNPKVLIGTEHSSGGPVRTDGEINIDVEGLVRTIVKGYRA